MKRLTAEQLKEQRLRELRRKLLHTRDKVLREIYKSHLEFLKETL